MHLFVCIHACLALACFGRQSVAISEATGGLATATAALLFSLLAVCVSNGSSNFVSKHDKANISSCFSQLQQRFECFNVSLTSSHSSLVY